MLPNREKLERDGFVWFRGALAALELERLEAALEFGSRPGYRPESNEKLLSLLGAESSMGALISTMLPGAVPVRFVAFNKTRSVNWAVPWHQDRVVAVKEKADVDGFSHWARRDSVWHAEPPIRVMDQMVFARIHFAHNHIDNGAMQLASGSHAEGKIAASAADQIANNYPIVTCEAERGDVILIKALTLHRSTISTSSSPRRALRVDYANQALPLPLQWGV